MADQKIQEVLIVGAGNIGRVYGYHLFKGGAKVHYYVREHNRQNLTNYPLRLHELTSSLRWFNKSHTNKFSEYTVTTDTDIANGNALNLPESLDYAIFTVPAYRLGQGDWLKNLVKFLNNKYKRNVYYSTPVPDETCMQRFMDMGIDKTKLISGKIGCNSYFASLANQKFEARGNKIAKEDNGENNPNKVVVYRRSAIETFGELSEEAKEATDRLVQLLNKGGLQSKNIGGNTEYGYFCTIMTPVFMSMSMNNWDLAKSAKNYSLMSLMTGSINEVVEVIKKKTDDTCNGGIKSMSMIPAFVYSILFYINHINSVYFSSYDIEAFSNAHFNVKLGGQTDHLIELIKSDAKKFNVKICKFEKLVDEYKKNQKKN